MDSTPSTATSVTNVTFAFDPGCPWTWMTSRWLVEVAEAEGFSIAWRAMNLAELNGGRAEIPDEWRAAADYGYRLHRMVEALHAAGRDADAGRLYAEHGARRFGQGADFSEALLEEAAVAAGVEDALAFADDDTWDAAVAASSQEWLDAAGGDVGSPVLAIDGADHATFGPIVNPRPTGERALVLWRAVRAAADVPEFYELKRGGRGDPRPTERL